MSNYFTEVQSELAVISRMSCPDNPRFKDIMAVAIKHLHAFVKETQPTMEEWRSAIEFLTATGQMCSDKRQEWILLSDILGVSMLMETINHRSSGGSTEATVLGPFHVRDAPLRMMGDSICLDGKGDTCFVHGQVMDTAGRPIGGAELDIWQTNDDGFYDVQQPGVQPDMNLRGRFITGSDGKFWFKTVRPVPYPIPDDGTVGPLLDWMGRHYFRPAHIHFIVQASDYSTLVTHLFDSESKYLDSDAVFGVKEELVIPFKLSGMPGVKWEAKYDFVLAPKVRVSG